MNENGKPDKDGKTLAKVEEKFEGRPLPEGGWPKADWQLEKGERVTAPGEQRQPLTEQRVREIVREEIKAALAGSPIKKPILDPDDAQRLFELAKQITHEVLGAESSKRPGSLSSGSERPQENEGPGHRDNQCPHQPLS